MAVDDFEISDELRPVVVQITRRAIVLGANPRMIHAAEKIASSTPDEDILNLFQDKCLLYAPYLLAALDEQYHIRIPDEHNVLPEVPEQIQKLFIFISDGIDSKTEGIMRDDEIGRQLSGEKE